MEYLNKELLKDIIDKNLYISYNEANKYIPEDFGDLKQDFKLSKAKIKGSTIEGCIFIDENGNSKKYATYIHDGVPSGASRKYYKKGGRRKLLSPFLISTNGTQFINRGADKVEDNL